jgi:hypothetical protein
VHRSDPATSLSRIRIPCTHTHVGILHTRAQPVNHTVLLESQGTDSRVAKRSWGRRDGVKSTPRDAHEKPLYLPLQLFPLLCARLPAFANPKRRETAPRNSKGTPPPQQRASGLRTLQLQQQSGGKQGGGAAPDERRLPGGGGVSSRNPYLHTTKPSGRVSCGGSVKRIGGGQARKYGKEGKPVGGRATTITV